MKKYVVSNAVLLALVALAAFASSTLGQAATCGRTCLLEQAKQFDAAMLGHTPEKIHLADGAQIRENTKVIALGESRWIGATKILSEGVYADPALGNVIEHVAAESTTGKPVYIGTQLKVANGRIAEIEINFDDGQESTSRIWSHTIRSSLRLCRPKSAPHVSSWSASLPTTSKD
jgi:hypothetical protein